MEKKLTQMSHEELVSYAVKWLEKRGGFEHGSRNWRKCNRRVKKAHKEALKRWAKTGIS